MLSYTDLKKGVLFTLEGEPYKVIDSSFSRMQQRKPVVQVKLRNLRSGKTVERTFQPSDTFEEAEVQKRPMTFLYAHRGDYVFSDDADPKNRLTLKEAALENKTNWLKPNTRLTALFFKDELTSIELPIKMDFRVIEAPPGVQGDRAQSGTKTVTIETGIVIQVPLFVNAGDTVRVNTETGEYVERVQKAPA
ncbi:MAG: elongation factor P [Candidatus Sungiibacteriota bacterium]|uniref:Elongation factor P n=1 Tax=Candidatus Sungiibacteriota bacterium TaxID=2750080 RepID=A0A7T5US81_9BACT|nr:MAG: elongation factor P [Candidatus Sungbacteria bacterium]